MQVIQKFFSLFFGLLLIPYQLLAEVVKEGIDVGYDYYSDNVGVTVYSPVIGLKKMLNDKWGLIANLRFDAITAASIKFAAGSYHNDVITDAVTGASDRAFDDLRIAPDISFVYESGISKTDFGFYGSTERDYLVFAVHANEQLSFNDANSIVNIGFSYSYEKWDPQINRALEVDDKNIITVSGSFTQLLSPRAYVVLNSEYTLQSGFLASPYRYINTPTYAAFEKYPDKRQSFPTALTYVQQFGDRFSTHLSYRFYADTWELYSHTADVKAFYDLFEGLTLGLRGRFYTQSAVGFMKPLDEYDFTDDPDYVVSEYKYSEFSSYSYGLSAVYRPTFIEDENIVIKFSATQYQTTDNDYIKAWYGENSITANYFTTAFSYEF